MRQEQVTSIRNLLLAVNAKGSLTSEEIEALVLYIAEVTKTEEEAVQRLSGILQNDLNGVATWKAIFQVELLREKIMNHQERLYILERNEKPEHSKLSIVQAIFIAISFIAATVALLKAFGFLQFPWLL